MGKYTTLDGKSSTSKLLRVKLIRTSQDKNFSTFPKFPPFIEDASIDKKASKLYFTKYEIDKKLNDGTPSIGAGEATSQAEVKDVSKLFGVN